MKKTNEKTPQKTSSETEKVIKFMYIVGVWKVIKYFSRSQPTKAEPWLNGRKLHLQLVYYLFYLGVQKVIIYIIAIN